MSTNRSAPTQRLVSPDTVYEIRVKKGIGMLDAILLSMGFTTTILEHIITPYALGGMGAALTSLGAMIASVIVVSIATVLIAMLISYSIFKLIDQDTEETVEAAKKEDELTEKKITFLARLLYVRYLLKQSAQSSERFVRILQTEKLASEPIKLAAAVDSLYGQEDTMPRIIDARPLGESEEVAIERYLHTHKTTYLPLLEQGWSRLCLSNPSNKKNWQSTVMGVFAGFISFLGMSSGLIGAYSSVITLVLSFSTINLAIPILGWSIFGVSLVFALAVAVIVKQCTDKSIKRQFAIEAIETQDVSLSELLTKTHRVEMQLVSEREIKNRPHALQKTPQARSLRRSYSWSGTFFKSYAARLPIEPEPLLQRAVLA